MKLEQSFEVAAPIDEVWAALIDVERVAPCLPGAQITEAGEDGTYRGTFQVKLGPTTAAYNGELHMEFVDEDAHQVVMKASGQDKRGQGAARATSRLVEADGSTRVDSVTDFTITGRLARFGRGGMIKDVSKRLFRDFSTCVSETITVAPAPAAEEAAPVSAGATPDADTDESPALDVGPERSGGPASAATAAPAAAAPPPPSRLAPAPAAPVSGGSLILGVVGGRIQRFLRRVFGPLVGRPPR